MESLQQRTPGCNFLKSLGMVPGTGAMVIPCRRWPEASGTFHNMLIKAEKLQAARATGLGVIDTLVDKHITLLPAAVWLAKELAHKTHHINDEPVEIAPLITEINAPVSVDGQRLSTKIVQIMRAAIINAAAVHSLHDALEIGYNAFGDSACTAAADEGINAFGEKRKPDFATTG